MIDVVPTLNSELIKRLRADEFMFYERDDILALLRIRNKVATTYIEHPIVAFIWASIRAEAFDELSADDRAFYVSFMRQDAVMDYLAEYSATHHVIDSELFWELCG